jgi:tetratricopeptide (TPR) repeat protein
VLHLEGDPTVVQTASEKNLITEQIVCSVLADDALDLREQIHRSSRSFDQNTAASFVVALLEQLTMHPDSVREHEALVVLGLAHPRVLRDQKVHLGHEGRRLAAKLETLGEVERAQELLEVLAHNDPRDRGVDKDLASIMRRTGNVERLVERYLFRAEQAVGDGRRRDAITWLREVLMLDRSRRDVARMIRDLQYESRQVKEGWKRIFRLVGLVLVMAGLGVGLVFREMHVARSYANLELPEPGNADSLRQRLSSLDSLIAGNPLWLGMFKAGRERASVRAELDRLDAAQSEAARLEADRRSERVIHADSARTRGLLLVDQRDFDGAAEQLRNALELAPAGWASSERTQADLDALEEFLAHPDMSSQDSDR